MNLPNTPPITAVLVWVAPTVALFVGQLPFDPEEFGRTGLLAAILGWFMFRMEKRLSGMEHSMNGLRRTMLIEIWSREGATPGARLAAKNELRRFDPDLVTQMEEGDNR